MDIPKGLVPADGRTVAGKGHPHFEVQNVDETRFDSGAFHRMFEGMNKSLSKLGTWQKATSVVWAMITGMELVAADGTRGVPDELYISVHDRAKLRVRLCNHGRVQHFDIEQIEVRPFAS